MLCGDKKGINLTKVRGDMDREKNLFIFVFSIETDNQSNYLDIEHGQTI